MKRHTFTTSRAMEFFTPRELAMQIGADPDDWPVVVYRELIDNALDALESANVTQPKIEITLRPDCLIVHDNGPGIPADVVRRTLDYSTRTSSNSLYPSPTRGQLGNALKCILAVPFVQSNQSGRVVIHAAGVQHTITIAVDQIRREPVIEHDEQPADTHGTRIEVHMASEDEDVYAIADLSDRFSLSNPAVYFNLDTSLGENTYPPVSKTPPIHWMPDDPIPVQWFSTTRFSELVSATIATTPELLIRDFLTTFRGMRGTSARSEVMKKAGLAGHMASLASDGALKKEAVEKLWAVMWEATQPVAAKNLGWIGEELMLLGMNRFAKSGRRYKRVVVEDTHRPYVIEATFGLLKAGDRREVLCCTNFSANTGLVFDCANDMLSDLRVDARDPVVIGIHVVCPNIVWLNRGKTEATLDDDAEEALRKALAHVTKEWQGVKRKSDRDGRAQMRAIEEAYREGKKGTPTQKEAAAKVMEEAYMKASSNNTLPANARQCMYTARGAIQELSGKPLKPVYFTQTLLPDFINDNPELTADWDVVFDARGNLIEPHNKRQIPLGTLQVRAYTNGWMNPQINHTVPSVALQVPTSGPRGRYQYALFIEKEGFNPLLNKAKIADRYDIAIMSTKGMSVTSARALIDRLTEEGVTILVAHDFDKSGIDILTKLFTDTRRYTYETQPNVIDLGVRWDDIQTMNLESEEVWYGNTHDKKGRANKSPAEILTEQGCTEDEVSMLVEGVKDGKWYGRRVELNAMTSAQFIDWLERKFEEQGIEKVVPEEKILNAAYQRACYLKAVEQAIQSVKTPEVEPPNGLSQRIKAILADDPTLAWDDAIAAIVEE